VSAAVLSLLDPSRKGAFDEIALQVAEDRINVGVHYPSDMAGGRKLAQAIFSELLKSPEFVKEIEQLKIASPRKCIGSSK
jgi:hypothetical protein